MDDVVTFEKIIVCDDFKIRVWSQAGYSDTYGFDIDGRGLKVSVQTIDENELQNFAKALIEAGDAISAHHKAMTAQHQAIVGKPKR